MHVGPSSERRRQQAVEALDLASAQRRERLDRVTRTAVRLLGADWAAVTVLDGDTVRLPSTAAAPADVPDRVPADETFCKTTTHNDEVLVVEDATADSRFDGLPLVTSGEVRAYAGVPLHDAAQNVVGVLCVFDHRARTFSPDEQAALLDLRHWAESELTAATEMAATRRVQTSMLPSAGVLASGWDIGGMCLPSAAVGGDFFDHEVLADTADLVVGDVMGKGTGAALLGASVRSAVRGARQAVVAGVDLGVSTTQIARAMAEDLERAQSFVTLMQAVIDLDDGSTRVVDVGLGLGLVVRATGGLDRLGGSGLPMGVLADDHWEERETELAAGDRLVLVSDGVLDVLDEPGRADWWVEVAAWVRDATDVDALLDHVRDRVARGVPTDDVTVLAAFRGAA